MEVKSFAQYVSTPVYDTDMKYIELYVNNLMKSNNFYLKFSSHFKDRINDDRNGKQISAQEIITCINKIYKRYPKLFMNIPTTGEKEIVLTDKESAINIPSIVRWSPKNRKNEFFLKTIMRKKNFLSSNNGTPQYTVEELSYLINIPNT